jgi:hypothetical protein
MNTDAFITEHYPTQGAAWCAKQLGMVAQAVQRRAAELGVKRVIRGPRLTAQQLDELRRDCADRRRLLAAAELLTPKQLAARYGVHEAHIRAIEKGRRYKGAA